MENNHQKSLNLPFDLLQNDSPVTIADSKINDAMILLSKKVNELIAKNESNKLKIFNKADFIENQYAWEIEDLEKKLNQKIEKTKIKLKNSLKKFSAEEIQNQLSTQKINDLNLLKSGNQALIDRIEKDENNPYNLTKVEAIKTREQREIAKIEKHYANLMQASIQNQNLNEVKRLQSESEQQIKSLQQEFATRKKQLLDLDAQSRSERLKEADLVRKSFQFQLIQSEAVTKLQVELYQKWLNSKSELEAKKMQLKKAIDYLEKDKSKAHFKAIARLEGEVKALEDFKITKTTPINQSQFSQISKLRIAKINAGIENNVNVLTDFTNQKMLPDLAPSFHTYKINPLLIPNNTYFAHKHHGLYKGIKFTLPGIGLAIGILLMVLFTLFAIQSTSVWINVSAEKITGSNSNIFVENMNLGFNALYQAWGLNATYWNAILAIGIIILLLSVLTIALRNHTLWSYCSIGSLSLFLIIGIALAIDTMVKMDFGQTFSASNVLIMTQFRDLIAKVQQFPNGTDVDNATWYSGLINSFETLITETKGTIPSWNPIIWA